DGAVLDLDEQAVAEDAGIRDGCVETAEVADYGRERADDAVLVRHVDLVGAGAGSGGGTARDRRVERRGIAVEQRQRGAAPREMLGHRGTEAASGARDEDGLARYFHGDLPSRRAARRAMTLATAAPEAS